MKIITTLLLTSLMAFAVPVTLQWDSNPPEDNVTAYELWYGTDPANLNLRSRVDRLLETTVNLAPDVYYFEVVAITAKGLKSPPSDRLLHTVVPGKPKTLRVVQIQTSSNNDKWKTIALVPQDPDEIPAEFVRARITDLGCHLAESGQR